MIEDDVKVLWERDEVGAAPIEGAPSIPIGHREECLKRGGLPTIGGAEYGVSYFTVGVWVGCWG
jgi:hypothetical protein